MINLICFKKKRNLIKFYKNTITNYKTKNTIIKTLEVRKTDAPDVYFIMCCEKYLNNIKIR